LKAAQDRRVCINDAAAVVRVEQLHR
jgi:hypothetical protein